MIKLYVSRDKDGSLYVFKNKPHKLEYFWTSRGGTIGSIDSLLLPSVKWEDEEPMLIEFKISI
jgi:hypothetical protein